MQRVWGLISQSASYLAVNLVAERERWFLWLPVAMGSGVSLYFAWPVEPMLRVGGAGLGGAIALLLLLIRRPVLQRLSLGVCIAALGFVAAEVRTLLVTAPMLSAKVEGVKLSGRVLEVEYLPTGRRVRLDRLSIEGLAAPPAQIRLRLSLEYPLLVPGDRARMKATLAPPSRPVAPGSYDFRRDLFFDGIGGVGFAYGRINVLPPDLTAGPSEFLRSIWHGFATLRATIEQAILRSIREADVAGVAVAFVTGSQSAVPKDALLAMRNSGLAHLLSVSGLHVGLVAGILFFLSRAALALVPPLALRWPIKKWAAGIALVGAVFYALLSGASVPVVRACLMASIALFAIICDRQPVSMRLIAWAALFVLVLWPESLVGPSFQLSFAAIIALTAMWEGIAPRRQRESSPTRRIARGVGDMILTSLVATLATAAFGVYHFNRMTNYGVIANMAAVPITGFWVMPFLILAVLLMPVGLEGLGLEPAGWGIAAILSTARTVAGWPGAVATVRAMPPAGIALVSLGGLWLCLWRRPWRWGGLVAIAAGFALLLVTRPPDILVSEDGKLVAVSESDGSLRLSSRRADHFAGQEWLRRAGQDRSLSWLQSQPTGGSRLICAADDCRYRMEGHEVAILRTQASFRDACERSDLVVSLVTAVGDCKAPVIDLRSLAQNGAYAIWLDPGQVRYESVRARQGDRPWTPPTEQSPGEDDQ
jgi:competence protein ComEC